LKKIITLFVSSLILALMSSPAVASDTLGFEIAMIGQAKANTSSDFEIRATAECDPPDPDSFRCPILNYEGTVVITTDDVGASIGTPTSFDAATGVASVKVTFSKAGYFSITATVTETDKATLVVTDQFEVWGFMVTTSSTLTAGTAQEFIIKYGNGVDALSGYTGPKTVVFTSTDTGATFGTITDFDKGVAKINVTFSKAGSFTVTATEADGTSSGGTSVAIDVAGFVVTTDGTVTAGTAQTFTITATSNGTAPIAAFDDFAVVTSSDGSAKILIPTPFSGGVATVGVTFSAAGSFTVTATENDGAQTPAAPLVGTLSVTVEAAPVVGVTPTKLLIAPKLDGAPVVDVGKVFTVSAVNDANAVDETFNEEKLVTITATNGEVTRADGAGTDGFGAIPLTFTAGVAEFTVNFSSVGAKTITATQGGLIGTLEVTVEAAVEETPAAPAAPAPATPAAPAPAAPAPVTTPASTPGFFSGAKWTITVDDAGVSTLDINLAKSQAGKNASFYKRTKQGKLILLDEEQRLGKNGKASITTDKLLRTGQKVRVQVDGKFRSTVTMP